jgi:hypothetical protein
MSEDFKPLIAIDFDGVVHSYEKGWQDGVIYGTVVPGFFEWCERVGPHFKLAIYSSRSKNQDMLLSMANWMSDQFKVWQAAQTKDSPPPTFEFISQKPAAWVTIDDRSITFRGKWDAPELSVEGLQSFRPWNAKS